MKVKGEDITYIFKTQKEEVNQEDSIAIKYMFCSLSDQLVMLDTIFRINVAG